MPFKTTTTRIIAVPMPQKSKSTRSSLLSSSSLSFVLLVLLLLQAMCSAQTVGNFYRENEIPRHQPPKDCYRTQRLSYSTIDSNETSYRLTVHLPKSVSRKTLNVDIDYDKGLIKILGWWMEQKVRGERPLKKACVYQEFLVDLEWLEQMSTDLSLYDLVMELHGQELALSLPKPRLHGYGNNLEEGGDDNTINEEDKDESPVFGRNLWKMIRGLARINTSNQNSTFMDGDDIIGIFWNDTISRQNGKDTSSMAYLRSRQDALERFLKFSLGATDEESYWLRRM
jgi:hypothetical protein